MNRPLAATTADALPEPIRAAELDLPGIRHGFFTREAGVSTGIYASLNCGLGSSDDRAAVIENRSRVARALGFDTVASPYQVHSPDVAVVEQPWEPGAGPKADAVVTRNRGFAIGVGIADCGPVLFADPVAGVVGAAHAGWRGAFGGVLEATVTAMAGLGAARDRILAVLGPTIAQPSYQVGPDFQPRFVADDPANGRFFTPAPRAGHDLFDLPGYIVARLGRMGLASARALGLDTYADETRFFSFRRTTHRGEPDYGRLIAAIGLA